MGVPSGSHSRIADQWNEHHLGTCFKSYTRTFESATLRQGPRNLCFNQPLGDEEARWSMGTTGVILTGSPGLKQLGLVLWLSHAEDASCFSPPALTYSAYRSHLRGSKMYSRSGVPKPQAMNRQELGHTAGGDRQGELKLPTPASPSRPSNPSPWKNCLPQNWSLVPEGWGPLLSMPHWHSR